MTLRGLALAGVLCLLAARASAGSADDDRESAREHYLKGTKAFDLGVFEEAIREYTEAYRLRDAPALLYNIAQSHRQAGHKTEALHFYKIYLSKVPRAENRDEVLSKISELQKAIEQEKKAQTMPPNQPIAPGAQVPPPDEKLPAQPDVGIPATEPPPPETSTAPTAEAQVASEAKPGAAHARTLKIAGGVMAGLGVAIAVAGIAMTAIGKSAADDLSSANANHQPYDPALYSASQTDPLVGGVLIGVGGAALVAGVAVLAVGVKRGKQSTAAMKVTPQLGPRHAGLEATLRF